MMSRFVLTDATDVTGSESGMPSSITCRFQAVPPRIETIGLRSSLVVVAPGHGLNQLIQLPLKGEIVHDLPGYIFLETG